MGITSIYSQITKKKENEPVLIIKPTLETKQKSSETQLDIRQKIDPSNLAVGIKTLRNIRDGGVAITCENTVSREVMKATITEQLGNKYKVEESTLKNPKVKIRDVENSILNLDNNTLIDKILKQNFIAQYDKMHFDVITKYEKNQYNGNIIVQVDSKMFDILIKKSKLSIGWKRCHVNEYFGCVRCFKCNRNSHKITNCTYETTCGKCAGNHRSQDCQANVYKCINCLTRCEKLNLKLDCNHKVSDINCPSYQMIIQTEKNKRNYTI